jgi:hypothetical protein
LFRVSVSGEIRAPWLQVSRPNPPPIAPAAGGQTTVYVGQHYEKNITIGQVTKYYFFNAQRRC